MRACVLALAAAAALTAAGCDESPTAPSLDTLAGRWRLQSMQPRDGAAIVPRSGVVLAVEFTGTRLSVQGDCNVCSGGFELAGSSFAAPRLACTRRACPEGTLENPFFHLISSATTATLVPDRLLRLSGPDGHLDLIR